jgi:aminomethyltransferase
LSNSARVWSALMERVKSRHRSHRPGARDTLRLEMKYCLYGNDIDANTNPLEAGLGMVTKLAKGDFIVPR